MAPEQRRVPVAPVPPRPPAGGALPDELRLVAAVLRKDRKATAQFVARYTDPVYAYVKHRLAPRADLVEDIVQDVFLAALASLERFRGASSIRSWLLGISRHKVEDYYRERLREPEPLGGDEHLEPPDERPLLDEAIDRQRMEARTQDVLRQLPEAYAAVLLWRYWECRSVSEIAAATGKTDKSVERLLARARARFRDFWEQT